MRIHEIYLTIYKNEPCGWWQGLKVTNKRAQTDECHIYSKPDKNNKLDTKDKVKIIIVIIIIAQNISLKGKEKNL